MPYLAKFIASALILFSCAGAYAQPLNPECPLAAKTVAIDGGIMSYLEGGKGEPVLLLHGLFAQKEQWLEVGCALAISGFDVIAPDLPGYGASTGYSISVYSLETQVGILHQLMERVRGGGIHIAGSSMGGAIASLYANQYPKEIKSLAFIGAPLGIVGWSPQVKSSIFQGVNPFIPINSEQFDLEMRLLFFKPPIVDKAIKSKLISEYLTNNRHYQQVWDIVSFYSSSLDRRLYQPAKTLILWGKQDGIFNIAGLPLLRKRFPDAQSYELSNAAHLLMLEQPNQVLEIYKKFLKP
jgi:abhydrolase domain-containing protein 6